MKTQNSKLKTIRETLKYAEGLSKIWDNKTPAQLIFFVTNRCNSHCRHCFYWRSLNKKTDELTISEIEKASLSMGRIFWLFLSGGEPFLRDDLPKICQIFYKNNKINSLVIPTNGLLAEKIEEKAEEIVRSCPQCKVIIQISVDGIGRDHDKLRGVKGNFAKIEKLVNGLKNLQKDYTNLALQINVVFCRENQDRIIKIYDEIYEKFGVDNICLSLIRGKPKEIGLKDVDLGRYLLAHKHLRKSRRFSQYTRLLSYLITKKEDMQVELFLKSFKEGRAIIPCLAASQSAVLYPNGDLSLCELRSEKFGNLREAGYDFGKLWRPEKLRQLRRKIKGCYCTQECVYTTNVFLNPKIWPMFVKYLTLGTI